jgi:hypothetical protein
VARGVESLLCRRKRPSTTDFACKYLFSSLAGSY